MKHYWWHHHPSGRYYAVATDAAGQIVSAWAQTDHGDWEARTSFSWLEREERSGDMHKNAIGFTEELSHSRGPVQ